MGVVGLHIAMPFAVLVHCFLAGIVFRCCVYRVAFADTGIVVNDLDPVCLLGLVWLSVRRIHSIIREILMSKSGKP